MLLLAVVVIVVMMLIIMMVKGSCQARNSLDFGRDCLNLENVPRRLHVILRRWRGRWSPRLRAQAT